MAAISSKQAQASLIDPMNEPEPSEDTGLNSHFGSTFAKQPATSTSKQPTTTTKEASPRNSLGSRNPFRDVSNSPTTRRSLDHQGRPNGSPKEGFPGYRAEAFGDYPPTRRSLENPARRSIEGHGRAPPPYHDDAQAGASSSANRPRRGSSLRERYPGDDSHKPLDIIRKNSKRADRSPHLNKRHMPGADIIDRLDPALGGRAYHHEGPYDAALLARNQGVKDSPIAALETTNAEALKATPRENVKDAVERHKPLDGVAFVPPGVPDQFGRTYNYEEGTDMMRDTAGQADDPGYKRWAGKEYDDEDIKGQSEPTFSLDRAFRTHKIDDDGIEMEDRAHLKEDYHKQERKGTLDQRDPVEIAGGEGRYVDAELQNYNREDDWGKVNRSSSLRHAGDSLRRRIGSLRHKNKDKDDDEPIKHTTLGDHI